MLLFMVLDYRQGFEALSVSREVRLNHVFKLKFIEKVS
jgi:hypothetical protein